MQKEAKSSINFKKANLHNFEHNDRSEEKMANTVFKEYSHLNQFSINATRGKNLFNNLYKNTIKKVVGRTRKANKKNCLWEALVNIRPTTKMEDLQKLQNFIEEEFGFKGLQIAIHKDEGQEEDGNLIRKNHHAHILFFTLDLSTARQMFRREFLTKKRLSFLQDKTAEILGMERGHKSIMSPKKFEEVYKKALNETDNLNDFKQLYQSTLKKYFKELNDGKAERLEHKPYKKHVKELESEKVKVKDLKDEIKSLREELKNKGLEREDFKKIEDKNKELLSLVKEKNLSIEELNHEIRSLKNELLNKTKNETKLKAENINLNTKVEDLIYITEEVRNDLNITLEENKIYEKVVKKYEKEIQELRNKNAMFLNQNDNLNLLIKTLKSELETFKISNNFKKEIEEIKLEKIPDTSHLKKEAKKRGNLNSNKYN
ncbi:hypothetical protein [Arcobacter sp.]|uniref:hypothetical protein n=1 Tax=unclassified Arcobacter TaxID=2593671 RepID=UPI003AFF66E9